VCIITCRSAEGALTGITANSFNSVSLDPPLILFSVRRSAVAAAAFTTASAFAVNILSQRQKRLSQQFARWTADQWAGVSHRNWVTGSPIIDGALANFDCCVESVHEGGDHWIILGRVLKWDSAEERAPLLFFRGEYGAIADPPFF
jgi:flavin reductase (DIM6/NTAB) family NADH-FMN oxidoreductase RutF